VPGPSFAAIVNHVQEKVPIGTIVTFIPCANGGAGEFATVSDPVLHVVVRSSIDASGGIHTSGHFQPIGNWNGIGYVTGDVYKATGVTRENVNQDSDGFPLEFTFVNNFRWIGPGPGNNLLVHENLHVTLDADGNVTVEVLNSSSECR
jgi:hypothetical protein